MDEPLWQLFWTTGLPEAYALAKQAKEKEETTAFESSVSALSSADSAF